MISSSEIEGEQFRSLKLFSIRSILSYVENDHIFFLKVLKLWPKLVIFIFIWHAITQTVYGIKKTFMRLSNILIDSTLMNFFTSCIIIDENIGTSTGLLDYNRNILHLFFLQVIIDKTNVLTLTTLYCYWWRQRSK